MSTATESDIETVGDERPVRFFTPTALPLATKAKVGGGGAPYSNDFMMSGAMALDWVGARRAPGTETLTEEVNFALDSLERTYGLLGGSLHDIVRMTVFVQEISFADEIVAAITRRYEGGPAPKLLVIQASVAYDCRLELETLALRPSAQPGPAPAPPVMLGVTDEGRATGAALPNFVFASARSQPRPPDAPATADDIAIDVRDALEKLDATLQTGGLSLRDVAKMLPWTDVEELRFPFIHAYTPLMSPAPFPGRALVAAGRRDAFAGSAVSMEVTVIR